MQKVWLTHLGTRPYQEVWELQEQLLQQNVQRKSRGEATQHHLLLVEHPPVYTLGKSGKKEHILIDDEERVAKGIEFFHINRGGDITFHGPGQIVGYPILDLEHFKTDLGWYLRTLEEVMIQTLAHYGIEGGRSAGETGAWIEPEKPEKARKICAMGIRCSRWITMHGWAFNVNTNLQYFDYIVPCGIKGKAVASLHREVGHELQMQEVEEVMLAKFAQLFDVQLAPLAITELLALVQANKP